VEATYPRKPFSRYTPCSTFNIFNSDESNVLFASIILVFATSNGVEQPQRRLLKLQCIHM